MLSCRGWAAQPAPVCPLFSQRRAAPPTKQPRQGVRRGGGGQRACTVLEEFSYGSILKPYLERTSNTPCESLMLRVTSCTFSLYIRFQAWFAPTRALFGFAFAEPEESAQTAHTTRPHPRGGGGGWGGGALHKSRKAVPVHKAVLSTASNQVCLYVMVIYTVPRSFACRRTSRSL
jgi:hypothetical protein